MGTELVKAPRPFGWRTWNFTKREVAMNELERLKFWIRLLELEVEALRSVLSEFDGDKSEFTQMQKANAIENLKNSLPHP